MLLGTVLVNALHAPLKDAEIAFNRVCVNKETLEMAAEPSGLNFDQVCAGLITVLFQIAHKGRAPGANFCVISR